MLLEGKTAVITGAGRGIGRAMALVFAAEGAELVLAARRRETVDETVSLVREQGGSAEPFAGDVSDSGAVDELAALVQGRWKTLDVLVNNAGVAADNLFLRMTPEEWDRVTAVNLRGPFLVTRALARIMARAKRGAIVNVSSVAGEAGNPGQANYSASKAGLIGFTKSLARELARYNIRVNALSPGLIDTDMTRDMLPEMREAALGAVPLGRMGTPDEAARAALFLASDMSSYITGQTLRVAGGLYI